jgi:hypothetical protein
MHHFDVPNARFFKRFSLSDKPQPRVKTLCAELCVQNHLAVATVLRGLHQRHKYTAPQLGPAQGTRHGHAADATHPGGMLQ